ncbi:MAG: LysR family transcriptional regulator [Adlercreutzia sp.]|nr:LysR family transcriptional regulator [Adlercreutzia sp.]
MQDFRVPTFLTVCRTLNYTRAAEELSLTQPAVTQQIAYLERAYGAKLFAYEHKRLSLTPAGRVLYQGLAILAHDDALLHEKVQAVAHGAQRPLRIGMTLTAGEYLVAAPLARYLAEHPDIDATVRSGGTAHLLELLQAGEIDCAFVEGLFDRAAYACDCFSSERFVGICAADHQFAAPPRRFEDLLGETLIVREEGSGSRAVLAHALAARNLKLSSFAAVRTVESLDIIKVFVAEDLGIAFVYEAAIARELAEGSLAVIPLTGPALTHDISFVRLKDSAYEDDYRQLFSALKERSATPKDRASKEH